MADLSQVPLDELMRMRAQLAPPPAAPEGQPVAAEPAPAASVDLGSMSLDDLMAMRDKLRAPAQEPPKAFTGGILPISAGPDGKVKFDTDAGVIGSIKRAVTLPGDVYAGKVDPMSDESIGRSFELAGLASPVTPAIRSGGAIVPGVKGALKPGKPEVPTSEALKAAGGAGFDRIREMGVDYSSDAVAKMAQAARADLEKEGFRSVSNPKAFSIIEDLASPPAGSIAPLDGLQAARRAAQKIAQNFNDPTEQAAASAIIRKLDKFVEAADPASVVAGPAAAAAKESVAARGNYAAAMRSEKLAGLEDRAELRAAAANSGQNLGNTLRQRSADILTRPKDASGFSEAELAGLESVARGTTGRNTARALGNLLGGGGGMGAVVTSMAGAGGGGAVGGPIGAMVGAAAPVLGYGAKQLENNLTTKAFRAVDEATRMRSPLYESALANPPMTPKNVEFENALVRTLLSSGKGGTPTQTTSPPQAPSPELRRALVKLLQEGGA